MALSDARAIHPGLATAPAEPEADAAALRDLAEWCGRYSPWTSVEGADGIWLDVTGCAHLFGGEDALLADIEARLAAAGLESRLGLADTPGTAWALARFGEGTRNIAPPGGNAAALAPLPVAALRLDEASGRLLQRLGLRRIGQLYDLPRAALARRFGGADAAAPLLTRLDQALGRRREPLSPLRPVPARRARLGLAEPLLDGQALPGLLDSLLADLCRALAADGQGAHRLVLTAYRLDGSLERVAVGTGRPSRDPDHLRRLFRDRLEAIDPEFGIDLLILAAEACAPLGAAQLSLSDRREKAETAGLPELIDRLSNRLGARRVLRSLPRASHRPERAERQVAAWRVDAAKAARADWDAALPAELPGGAPARPFRLLARPEPIGVTAEVPEGPPVSFTWRRVTRRVLHAEGPERLTPEWWLDGKADGSAEVRDYYRVEDREGRRYWLFREGLYQDPARRGPPAWFIHGLFA